MLDERTRFSLMLLAGGAVAVLVGWCAWIAVRSTDSAPLPRPAAPKVFRKTLMEGLRVTHGGVKGVEFIKCRTCRLEKRRQGNFFTNTRGGCYNKNKNEGGRSFVGSDLYRCRCR